MFRFLRLSLAQVLLLTALVALVLTVIGIANRRFSVMHNDPSLAVSPNGNALATGISCRPLSLRKHPILVKDLSETPETVKLYESHSWPVMDVVYSKDGSKLYSAGDRSIRIWDTATGAQLDRIDTGSHSPRCLAISPDEKTIVTGGETEVNVWDVESRKMIAQLVGHKSLLEDVVFSPDGMHLATGGHDPFLYIWDTGAWNLKNTIKTTSQATTIAFTPDGKLVTRGYRPETKQHRWQCNATVYEVPSGDVLDIYPVDSYAAVSCVAVSQDGKFLAAAHGGDRKLSHCAITVWDLDSKKELKTLNIRAHGENWIDAMEFSTDGATLFCGSDNNVVTSQRWREGTSTVVFASGRVFPWELTVGGGVLWLAAWFLAPRLQKVRRNGSVAAELVNVV